MSEVEALAAQMYTAAASVAPTWEQLGDVTRGVWLERAQAVLFGDTA